MNLETGAIAVFETDEDAETAGYTIPLSKVGARLLLAMPRSKRLERLRKGGHKGKGLARRWLTEPSSWRAGGTKSVAENVAIWGRSP